MVAFSGGSHWHFLGSPIADSMAMSTKVSSTCSLSMMHLPVSCCLLSTVKPKFNTQIPPNQACSLAENVAFWYPPNRSILFGDKYSKNMVAHCLLLGFGSCPDSASNYDCKTFWAFGKHCMIEEYSIPRLSHFHGNFSYDPLTFQWLCHSYYGLPSLLQFAWLFPIDVFYCNLVQAWPPTLA